MKNWSSATTKACTPRRCRGEIPSFTGVSDPYEEPLNPELVIETDREKIEAGLQRLIAKLEQLGYIAAAPS